MERKEILPSIMDINEKRRKNPLKITFFDAKAYERDWFGPMAKDFGYDIDFYESRFTPETAYLAKGSEAVCLFVTDKVDEAAAKALEEVGVKVILLRSAGFDHVDLAACAGRLTVLRVPSYSPEAIAEFGAALLLTLARRVHRAYLRTRSFDFRLNHLMGVTLRGKTAGIIGTGRIGKLMIEILQGLGMKILAYDMFPDQKLEVEYVPLETLFAQSDVISLHCPLTPETKYMIDEKAIEQMKDGVILVNTSRGGLVDTKALIEGVRKGKFGGVALDVYEREDDVFFEDHSGEIMQDEDMVQLLSFTNVVITSHQAYFTDDAMEAIARTTLENLREYEQGLPLSNEVKAQ